MKSETWIKTPHGTVCHLIVGPDLTGKTACGMFISRQDEVVNPTLKCKRCEAAA